MKAGSMLTTAALVVLLGAAPAAAQGLDGRWSVSVQGGTDTEIAGNVVKAASGEALGVDITIESRSYRDIYTPKLRGQLVIGYGVSDRGEVFARGSYYRTETDGFLIGTADDGDLFAFMDPYEEYGVELGYRFYLSSRTRLKSFVGPVAGARFLDRVLVALQTADGRRAIRNVPFYKSSAVPVFGADIGFTFDLGETFYVGLETGIRYQAKRSEGELPPEIAVLAAINDEGDRWSAPVVLTLGVRF